MEKKQDFQWLKDMPKEDYKYLTDLEDPQIIEIIHRIVNNPKLK